jgi:hypothetical protein
MKIIRLLLVLIPSFFVLNACKTRCGDQGFTPVFIGFPPADLDTIILKKYLKGGNTQNLLDSTIITRQTTRYQPSNDTTVVMMNDTGEDFYLTPDFDWQMYLPAKRVTISITDIVSPHRTEHCYDCGCINSITSFLQNGQLITSPPYSLSSFLLFIHK